MAGTLGTVQPFRYRGYVYDVETGLYYLRSRYYNPEWGRFINADAQVIENMYTYCKNTPILFVDNNGYEPKLANDSVILRNGPSNKASVVFTIMNKGAECYVLFPVCDDDGVAIWYFIEYERKNGKRLNGYVRAEDIIDNKHMDFTQLSHKQMTAGLNHCGENQEEKRSVDNQAGTQFAESNLLKNGRKSV